MPEAVFVAVVAGVIIGGLAAAWRWAWARDRIPIRVRPAPRIIPDGVRVNDRPDHSLPPSFIFPAGKPTSAPPDPETDTAKYIDWALTNDGVHVDQLFHRFTIRGADDGPVHLDRVAVKVLSRRAPLTGHIVEAAAGGDSVERQLIADLDVDGDDGYAKAEQIVDSFDPQTGDYVPKPWNLLRVSRTDDETFVLMAHTQRHDCEFVVKVHYRGQHQSGVYTVNRGGKPFRVSARPEPRRYVDLPARTADG